MRTILVLLGFACLSSCAYHPPGSCNTTADCGTGNRCEQGVCLAGCDDDSQCSAWQQCGSESKLCELRPGKCGQASDCESFEACTGNVCVLAESACRTSADCQSWETCDESHACALQAGRCNSSDQCGGIWGTCDATNTCRSEPPEDNDILLVGTLEEGACYMDAVAPIGHPEHPTVGFGCNRYLAHLLPNGSLIYLEGDTRPHLLSTPRLFVGDSLEYVNGRWQYPLNPYENDPILPTPGCASTLDVRDLLVQEGTGNILHRCNQTDWLDESGQLVVSASRVYAWNAAGQFFANQAGVYVLLDTQGAQKGISGLPVGTLIDARAGGNGFLVALRNETVDPAQNELWEVDGQGQALRLAVYGASPVGYTAYIRSPVLDRSGALYTMEYDPDETAVDLIVRYPVDGSPGAIVYSEANAPEGANDFDAPAYNFYAKIHTSQLVRGP